MACYNISGENQISIDVPYVYVYTISLDTMTPVEQDTEIMISYLRSTAVLGTNFVGPTTATMREGDYTVDIELTVTKCGEEDLFFDIELLSQAVGSMPLTESCDRFRVTLLTCTQEDVSGNDECFTRECCLKYFTEGHDVWKELISFPEPQYS